MKKVALNLDPDFSIFGYVKCISKIGFCIPIFSKNVDERILFFQDISKSDPNKISGFTQLDDYYDHTHIVKLQTPSPQSVKKGGNPIFAFQVLVDNENDLSFLRSSSKLYTPTKKVLIFGKREDLFIFFKLCIIENLIKDRYVIAEILNLFSGYKNYNGILQNLYFHHSNEENIFRQEAKRRVGLNSTTYVQGEVVENILSSKGVLRNGN